MRLSYIYNENPNTGKTITNLYDIMLFIDVDILEDFDLVNVIWYSTPSEESWEFSINKLEVSLETYTRDHFVNAPSQWGTTLHCNIISHCLGAYTKWSQSGS